MKDDMAGNVPLEPSKPATDGPAAAAGNNKGCFLGCLGMTAVVIALAVSCSVAGGGDNDRAPSKYEAEVQCQDWVRDKLKAPSTAEFSETRSTGGPASWTISGAVDAENGFGAMLRSSWTCNIELDGDMWRGSAILLD
ncbi:hypothetical protein [Cellulomonas sp. Root137]|uniref:hypothetical protein n=1 Tax=Cellulomonas sp. Root137 TaxID=1736459 RepID=UPI0006FCE20F|nr:hypothetical protein [Cellulomonas sp. Root137]KQY41865.1 hypothetical protein ASD18_19700 [Cellulomonas sp. Root137]